MFRLKAGACSWAGSPSQQEATSAPQGFRASMGPSSWRGPRFGLVSSIAVWCQPCYSLPRINKYLSNPSALGCLLPC